MIRAAVYQERREGQSDLKFEGKVQVFNTGNTPARKFAYKKAGILHISALKTFAFPLPEEDKQPSYASSRLRKKSVSEMRLSSLRALRPARDCEAAKTDIYGNR